jgi:hypothetical protein
MARVDVATKATTSVLSLRAAAEQFAERFRAKLSEIKAEGSDWRRLRLKFPSVPHLYDTIRDSTFYEDLLSEEQLSRDFLIPLRYLKAEEIKLTKDLDLKTFYGAWRYLQFLDLVDIALLRTYSKDDPTILLNSLVRVTAAESMVELIEGCGVSKQQARDFLGVISADVNQGFGYLDLQYRPAQTLIPEEGKLAIPEVVHLPVLVVTANVLRNIQAANKFRVECGRLCSSYCQNSQVQVCEGPDK